MQGDLHSVFHKMNCRSNRDHVAQDRQRPEQQHSADLLVSLQSIEPGRESGKVRSAPANESISPEVSLSTGK
jgi:hypothetical protein